MRVGFALNLATGKLTSIDVPGTILSLLPDRAAGELYAALSVGEGANFVRLFSGETRLTGEWMGRIEKAPQQAGFAWVSVSGTFTDADGSPATVRLRAYADDDGTGTAAREMAFDLEVADNRPVRLPAWRGEEFILHVTTTAIVDSIVLASSTAELQQVA